MKNDLQGHQLSADVNGIECVYNDKWKDLCYGLGMFYEGGP